MADARKTSFKISPLSGITAAIQLSSLENKFIVSVPRQLLSILRFFYVNNEIHVRAKGSESIELFSYYHSLKSPIIESKLIAKISDCSVYREQHRQFSPSAIRASALKLYICWNRIVHGLIKLSSNVFTLWSLIAGLCVTTRFQSSLLDVAASIFYERRDLRRGYVIVAVRRHLVAIGSLLCDYIRGVFHVICVNKIVQRVTSKCSTRETQVDTADSGGSFCLWQRVIRREHDGWHWANVFGESIFLYVTDSIILTNAIVYRSATSFSTSPRYNSQFRSDLRWHDRHIMFTFANAIDWTFCYLLPNFTCDAASTVHVCVRAVTWSDVMCISRNKFNIQTN